MDDSSIDIIIEVAFVVGAILFSLIKGWIGKKASTQHPAGNSVPRAPLDVFASIPSQNPAPQPRRAPSAQQPHTPAFVEGERVTAARPRPLSEPSAAASPHVTSNEQRREAALRRLGLKNKDELRRAIILGQILERPQS